MVGPVPPTPPAGPQQAQANPPQYQSDLALADREPTYSIFGGSDGESQLIQFHMSPGQNVTLHGGRTGGSSFLYAHSDASVYECQRYYRNQTGLSVTPKDEHCSHPGGDDPLIYLGAAVSHAGKILPIKRFGERMPLLVQDDCLLASTGQVEFKQVCLKAGFGTEKLQMILIAPLAYSQWDTRRSVRGRPGTVFVHSPGTIMQSNLGPDESIHVYTSAIVALTEGMTLQPPSTNASLYWVEKKKEVCLMQGPGTIYVSSLPLSKQARRLMKARPPKSTLSHLLSSNGFSVPGVAFLSECSCFTLLETWPNGGSL